MKQIHKEGKALRTETTINNTRDFGIGKRLTNLPALREIGFQANRRLLRARITGLRIGEQRSYARCSPHCPCSNCRQPDSSTAIYDT